MTMPAYDDANIFAKILRGEIPNKTVYEDEHVLAFEDIAPQRPTHVLIIPKGPYVSLEDFSENASEAEIVAWVRAIGKIGRQTGASRAAGGNGFRFVCNAGSDGVQDVPHLHGHLLAGSSCGPMLSKAK